MRRSTPAVPLRRRPLRAVAACCLSLLVVALASCSSTTKNGGAGPTGAAPANTRTAAAQTGPIRVTFEVDTFPDAAGKPIPKAPDSVPGKAVLKFVKQYNSALPAGGRPIEAGLISTADVLDTWASDNPGCDVVLPASAPPPDVFVVFDNTWAVKDVDCYLKAGTIVMVASSTVVPGAWLKDQPGVFLLRGTTFPEWGKAVSAALDDSATPPSTVVVMGVKEVFTMDQALADAAYQEVLTSLQAPGRTVTLFHSPAVGADLASSEAAFALVPTKLRRLGADAVVLPGISGDPIPAEAMEKQKFTPPVFAAPGAVLSAFGYPQGQVRSLPAPARDRNPEAAAVRLRTAMGRTAQGKACLQTIEADGRKAEAEVFSMLVAQCDVLATLTRAVQASPDALASPRSFGSALSSLGPVSLADGTSALFSSATPQLGLPELSVAQGNDTCECLLPTDQVYPLTP